MIEYWTVARWYGGTNIYTGMVAIGEGEEEIFCDNNSAGKTYSKYVIKKERNTNIYKLRMMVFKDHGENWNTKENRVKIGYRPCARFEPRLKEIQEFKTLKAAKAYAATLEAEFTGSVIDKEA